MNSHAIFGEYANMEQNHPSRRDLLQLGAAAGAASILAGCNAIGSRQADVVAPPQNGRIVLSREQSAKLLASADDVLVEPQGFDDKILVVHGKDGSLHGLSAICTHLGCTVGYEETLGHIRCPCHGSQFGLDGHNIRGPAQRPLRQYDVRAENGLIALALRR
jgi:Rieske Fe-S protein